MYIGTRLVVYSVTDHGNVTLHDTLELKGDGWSGGWEPRVDHSNGWVYIPAGKWGIWVIRYDCSKLVLVTRLKCVGNAKSVAIVSADRLYVCDYATKTVCVVDVKRDEVTSTLQVPPGVGLHAPHSVAILGDTALVGYDADRETKKGILLLV